MELLTLFGLLAAGSFTFWAFWIVFVVFSFVMVALTETEHWGWALTITAAGFVVLFGTGIFDLVKYTAHHPMSLFIKVLEYIGCGLVWGTIKWWRFVLRTKHNYLKAKAAFLNKWNSTEMTDDLKVKWSQQVKDSTYNYRPIISEAPQASEHKETIINWMALWPFSVLGTLFYDFLKELWDALYEAVSGVYNSISKSIYKDISGDVLRGVELEKALAASAQYSDGSNRESSRNR
jgi:hypothetical protein